MEQIEKIVEFEIYCASCEYLEVDDINGKDPCNECLGHPTNINSTKPILYKKKENTKKKK